MLKLYPHAIHDANAYYSPEAHGILFGYFAAGQSNQGRNLPGQRVFTCLSHDIIAHEVTHAVIDGIRTYFTEPTNPDVLAFHEGFADLCALFSHFSLSGALEDAIRRTGGRLFDTDLSATSPSTDPGDDHGAAAPDEPADPAGPAVRRGSRHRARAALGARDAAQQRRHPHAGRRPPLPRLHPRGGRLRRLLQRLHAPRRRALPDLPLGWRHAGRRSPRAARPAPRPDRVADRRLLLPTLRASDRLLPAGRHHVRRLPARPDDGGQGPRPGRPGRHAGFPHGGVPAARHLSRRARRSSPRTPSAGRRSRRSRSRRWTTS